MAIFSTGNPRCGPDRVGDGNAFPLIAIVHDAEIVGLEIRLFHTRHAIGNFMADKSLAIVYVHASVPRAAARAVLALIVHVAVMTQSEVVPEFVHKRRLLDEMRREGRVVDYPT